MKLKTKRHEGLLVVADAIFLLENMSNAWTADTREYFSYIVARALAQIPEIDWVDPTEVSIVDASIKDQLLQIEFLVDIPTVIKLSKEIFVNAFDVKIRQIKED